MPVDSDLRYRHFKGRMRLCTMNRRVNTLAPGAMSVRNVNDDGSDDVAMPAQLDVQ
jgi:hypothetical protein